MSATRGLLDELQGSFITYLYNPDTIWKRWLASLEEKTGIKREHVVYGLMTCLSAYLVLGYFAELVCNTIGFAYPAYASMKAIRTAQKEDDTQWLTYWTVFAVCSLIDFGSDRIMGWFPLYWLVKCIFFLWLWMPMFRGAEKVWNKMIGPMFDKYENKIDAAAAEDISALTQTSIPDMALAHDLGDVWVDKTCDLLALYPTGGLEHCLLLFY